MSISTDALRDEILRGDEEEARLENALVALRQSSEETREHSVLSALIYDPETFDQMVRTEQQRCARIEEALSIVEIAFDEELSAREETLLAAQLLELGNNVGDFVGVTSEKSYAVALPWTNATEALNLANIAIGMADYVAPAKRVSYGTQTITTTAPRPQIQLQPGPVRTRYTVAEPTLSAGRRL